MATILVIDDQEPIRALLRLALEGAGYEVLEASNGRLGLVLYGESAADLIITDIVMPEMDGLELMLDLTSNFLNVKVIAISGGLEGEAPLHVAKLLGARQTFYKPLRWKQYSVPCATNWRISGNASVLRTTHDKYGRTLPDVSLLNSKRGRNTPWDRCELEC